MRQRQRVLWEGVRRPHKGGVAVHCCQNLPGCRCLQVRTNTTSVGQLARAQGRKPARPAKAAKRMQEMAGGLTTSRLA